MITTDVFCGRRPRCEPRFTRHTRLTRSMQWRPDGIGRERKLQTEFPVFCFGCGIFSEFGSRMKIQKMGIKCIHDSMMHPPCRLVMNQHNVHGIWANGILFAFAVVEIFHFIATMKLRQETGGKSRFVKPVIACMVRIDRWRRGYNTELRIGTCICPSDVSVVQ